MQTGTKRPLEELKDKAFQALVHPDAVWVVRNSSNPTATHEMARREFDDTDMAKACRFAAMMRRDYGKEEFEAAVLQENAPGGSLDLIHEENVRAFGCLSEVNKRLVWSEFLKLALAPQLIEFLRVVYEDLEQEDYKRWELHPFEQEALRIVTEPVRQASNQDLINFLHVAMIPGGTDPSALDDVIALLRERRPTVEQCVAAIIAGNLFADTAWKLIAEDYDLDATELRTALDAIISFQKNYTPDWLVEVAERMRRQLV